MINREEARSRYIENRLKSTEAYFGATGGGLWKTTDGGDNWAPVTDFKITAASIGAAASKQFILEVYASFACETTAQRDKILKRLCNSMAGILGPTTTWRGSWQLAPTMRFATVSWPYDMPSRPVG